MIVVTILFQFNTISGYYLEDIIKPFTRWHIHNVEAYKHGLCVAKEGEKQILLSNNKVLLSKEDKEEISFRIDDCTENTK